MSIAFKTGRSVDPSGFPLALIDIPQISPNTNVSVMDKSYLWEENISSSDTGVVTAYVGSNGSMPGVTTGNFVVTNITTHSSNDMSVAPLYYKHLCRFYHYSFGDNPVKQVYITDQNGNILKGINYFVKAERVAKFVYKIYVFTDFVNGTVVYHVKYNRCASDGTQIFPSWTETLNAQPALELGSPSASIYQYLLIGPDTNGLYNAGVPEIPTLSPLTNTVGVSFDISPTLVDNSLANIKTYTQNVLVTYTLKATSSTTFTVFRDLTRSGGIANNYLTSATTDSWGSATNFSTGTVITGVPGVSIYVGTDNPLIPNDTAYFTASKAYFYLSLTSYEALYLAKPINVGPDQDWYLRVKNGRFRKRFDSSGNPAPYTSGTLWEYSIPEYDNQIFNSTYGKPYADIVDETPTILDKNTIQLYHTPLFMNPTGVLLNPNNPGFPPSGLFTVHVNDTQLPENYILDWDVQNGTISVAQNLSSKDNLKSTYIYDNEFYEYPGFLGSGSIYSNSDPFPFYELNVNPSPDLGYGIYASGLIASIFAMPCLDVDTGVLVNPDQVLYHNFTGIADSAIITNAYTTIVAHFSGVNNATTYTADTGQVASFFGNAKLDTSSYAYRPASLSLDGVNSYVTFPYVKSAQFRTNDFTVEFKLRMNSLTNAQEFIGQYNNASNNWYMSKSSNASGNKLSMVFTYGGVTVGSYIMTSNWTGASINVWNTIMFGRTGGHGVISINGVPQTITETVAFGSNDLGDINTPLRVGHVNASYVNGWIDELVTVNGKNIYPSTYQPYSSPYRYGQVDFLIGNVSLGPNCKIGDITVIDARSRSGGLNALGIKELDKVIDAQPEAQFYWDDGYFDGQAVPADGVMVIALPKGLLKSNGGPFNEDEVRQRVNKHISFGSYAIIQYF